MSGCKKKPVEPEKTPEEIQIEKLSKVWVPKSGINAVTLDGTDVSTDWSGFSLNMGDKIYSSSGADQTNVWPASGTWDFNSNTDGSADINTILRSSNSADVEIAISVTETSLTMQFDYDASLNGRLSGTTGNWIFNMVPQ
jgi:hypothetical protein